MDEHPYEWTPFVMWKWCLWRIANNCPKKQMQHTTHATSINTFQLEDLGNENI